MTTMTAPAIVDMISRGAEDLVASANARRTVSAEALETAYIDTCEQLLETFLANIAKQHGTAAAARLAATIDAFMLEVAEAGRRDD